MTTTPTVFSDITVTAEDEAVPDFRASAEASEAAGEADTSPAEDFSGLLNRSIGRNGSREVPKAESSKGRKAREPKAEIPFPRTKDGFKPAIEQAYYGVSTAVIFIDPEIAGIISQIAPDAAEALNELAKTNPKFRRFLHNMLQTSAVGAVIVAHLPLILALVNKAVANNGGTVPDITTDMR